MKARSRSGNASEGAEGPPIGALGHGLESLALLQVALGLFLAFRYSPALDGAARSVAELRSSDWSRILLGFHYWGSAVLLAGSFFLLLALALDGRFDAVRKRIWYGAALVLLTTLGLQITGNLLPMDAHDVQTAGIEADIAARIPGIGPTLSEGILQGPSFGQSALDAWYFAHKWVLTPLLVLGGFLLGGSLEKRKWTPYAAWLPLGAAVLLALLLPSPHGEAATPLDYGLRTAQPAWYVMPLHAALRAFDTVSAGWGWLGATLIPGLFVLYLAVAPLLAARFKRVGSRLMILAWVAMLGVLVGFFGSEPAPIYGMQTVRSEKMEPNTDPAEPIDKDLAAQGRKLFNSLACKNCHGPDGTDPKGAPRLTGVHERYPNAEWYMRFIRDSKSVRPGSTMPSFPALEDGELRQLAEFLRDPQKGGASP